jgi:hypothetical protein
MDPLNDGELEREIERSLAVDPSPEFLARVRTRLAEEPRPAAGRFGWMFVGIATTAVAAAVVLAVFVVSPARRPASAPLLISRPLASPLVAPTIARAGLDRSLDTHDEPRTTNDERRTTNLERRTSNDERRTVLALFDTHETLALQRLIANVRDARVDLTPLLKEGPMSLPANDDLMIPPIVIEPLAPSGVEGERP